MGRTGALAGGRHWFLTRGGGLQRSPPDGATAGGVFRPGGHAGAAAAAPSARACVHDEACVPRTGRGRSGTLRIFPNRREG